MATPESPTTPRSLVPWVVVLGVIVVGLAGWIAYDLFVVEDAAPDPEVASLVEDFTTSLDAYDVDTASDLVTPDFATNFVGHTTGVDGAITWAEAADGRTTIVGPMISQAEGDWTVVAVPISMHGTDQPVDEGHRIMATFVVRDSAAEGPRIAAFWVERPSAVSPRVG